MNYRERIRKELLTNDTGQSIHYHKLNELKHDRKMMILRLLDEMDRADEYIKRLYLENEKLKEILKEYAPYFVGITMSKEIDNLDISVFEEFLKKNNNSKSMEYEVK